MNLRLLTTLVGFLFLIYTALAADDHSGHHHDDHGSINHGEHGESHSLKGEDDGVKAITGEVVDLSCYLGHGAKGPGHKSCAIACAKKGLPMGVLSNDNKLYLLVEDHGNASAYKKAVDHAAEIITVKGQVYNAGGVQAIQVKEVSDHH